MSKMNAILWMSLSLTKAISENFPWFYLFEDTLKPFTNSKANCWALVLFRTFWGYIYSDCPILQHCWGSIFMGCSLMVAGILLSLRRHWLKCFLGLFTLLGDTDFDAANPLLLHINHSFKNMWSNKSVRQCVMGDWLSPIAYFPEKILSKLSKSSNARWTL